MLDFDDRAPLRALASRWHDRIIHVADDAADRMGLSAMLVRPNDIVAWISEATPDQKEAGQAASRWFGDPEEGRESA